MFICLLAKMMLPETEKLRYVPAAVEVSWVQCRVVRSIPLLQLAPLFVVDPVVMVLSSSYGSMLRTSYHPHLNTVLVLTW
jgi:hypothetical protein